MYARLDISAVQDLLIRRELNILTLARQCKIAPKTLTNILRGGRCTYRSVGKICNVLNVPPADILKF